MRVLTGWITDCLLAAPLGFRSDYFRWYGIVLVRTVRTVSGTGLAFWVLVEFVLLAFHVLFGSKLFFFFLFLFVLVGFLALVLGE